MELTDLGYKDNIGSIPTEVKQDNKIRYPELYLSDVVPEALMDKDTGEMCRLEIIAKVIDKGIQERDGKETRKMTLQVQKIGYLSKAGKKTKDEYLKMDEGERNEYDKEQLTSNEEDEDKEEDASE
jgi:hypothetical protein